MALSRRHFAATLRGATSRRHAARRAAAAADARRHRRRQEPAGPAGLARHDHDAARPARGAWQVARVELTELRSSPGLYLFVPLILLQTLGTALVDVGFLDTPLLVTPGTSPFARWGR